MNGDQKPQAPETETEWLHKTADNPPSLSEPSQPQVTIAPAQPPQAAVAAPIQPAAVAPLAAPSTPEKPQEESIAEDPDDGDDPEEVIGFYHPDSEALYAESLGIASPKPDKAIEWVSSGDELQARSSAWRIRMILLSVVAAAIIYAITRDVVSSGAVVIAGILFGFLGARKPPAIQYKLDSHGFSIGPRVYSYREFRAFSVADDIVPPSINIVPLKRFSPMLSIHFDVQHHDEIVDILAQHLPLEEHRHDAFDSIITRIKF